jgi:hypothetical protein
MKGELVGMLREGMKSDLLGIIREDLKAELRGLVREEAKESRGKRRSREERDEDEEQSEESVNDQRRKRRRVDDYETELSQLRQENEQLRIMVGAMETEKRTARAVSSPLSVLTELTDDEVTPTPSISQGIFPSPPPTNSTNSEAELLVPTSSRLRYEHAYSFPTPEGGNSPISMLKPTQRHLYQHVVNWANCTPPSPTSVPHNPVTNNQDDTSPSVKPVKTRRKGGI